MKRYTAKPLLCVLLVTGLVGTAAAQPGASELDAIHSLNKKRTDSAQQSQKRVDRLSDQANVLLDEYRAVNKQIEGLKIYNRQLEIQTAAQQRQLDELQASITQATQMKRQVTPLMVEMTAGLERFIALDLPFHQKERQQRLDFIQAALDNPDVADSEKFRQVLEAYQIENEYGRKIDVTTTTINPAGEAVHVNLLRVGRIALIAQTRDQARAWVWDNEARQWQTLDDDYQTSVRNAIRIARKQAAVDMLMLPVPAPKTVTAQEVGHD